MMPILLALVLLYFGVRGLLNPFIGLLGLIVVNMVNPGELYPVFAVLHVERVFVVIVFISMLLRFKVHVPPISRNVLIFYASLWFSGLFAYYKGAALARVLDFGQVILYHLLIVNLVDDAKKFRTFIVTFVLLVGWIAGGTLWGYQHGNFNAGGLRAGIERAQGLTSAGGDPNSLGITLVSALPLVGLLLLQGSRKQKVIALAVFGISIVAVVLTASRTAFAVMVLLIGAFFVTRRKAFVYLPLALALFAVIWMSAPDQFKKRYVTITKVVDPNVDEDELDESYLSRLYAWKAGREMFADYPLTGVGPGNFKTAIGTEYWPGKGRKRWLNPHNLYIQLIAELGILGVIVWGAFQWQLWKLNWRMKTMFAARDDLDGIVRYYPLACLFCLFALFVAGYSSHSLYRSTWYFLAALSGALYSMQVPTAVRRAAGTAFVPSGETVVESALAKSGSAE
jgi:O-antigen ligase